MRELTDGTTEKIAAVSLSAQLQIREETRLVSVCDSTSFAMLVLDEILGGVR